MGPVHSFFFFTGKEGVQNRWRYPRWERKGLNTVEDIHGTYLCSHWRWLLHPYVSIIPISVNGYDTGSEDDSHWKPKRSGVDTILTLVQEVGTLPFLISRRHQHERTRREIRRRQLTETQGVLRFRTFYMTSLQFHFDILVYEEFVPCLSLRVLNPGLFYRGFSFFN